MSVPSAFDAKASPERRRTRRRPRRCRSVAVATTLPCLIVRHRHHAAAASAEQPMMSGVDRHRDRLLARGGGPSPRDRCGLRVDLDHLARVGEIRVHLAVAGRDAVFGFAAERNVRDQRAGLRIDDRRGVRVAIEREHAVRRAVVDDRVGVFGGRNPAEHLERSSGRTSRTDWSLPDVANPCPVAAATAVPCAP